MLHVGNFQTLETRHLGGALGNGVENPTWKRCLIFWTKFLWSELDWKNNGLHSLIETCIHNWMENWKTNRMGVFGRRKNMKGKIIDDKKHWTNKRLTKTKARKNWTNKNPMEKQIGWKKQMMKKRLPRRLDARKIGRQNSRPGGPLPSHHLLAKSAERARLVGPERQCGSGYAAKKIVA